MRRRPQALALLSLTVLVLTSAHGASAMNSGQWRVSWGGDIVPSGALGDHGPTFEFCAAADQGTTYTPTCQAARRSGLGGEFAAAGPAGNAVGPFHGAGRATFVADPGGNRIQVFNLAPHAFASVWGQDVIQSGHRADTGAGAEVCRVALDCQAGTPGGRGGALNGPTAVGSRITGGETGIYVADTGNHRIVKYTGGGPLNDGAFVAAWGKDVVQGGGTGYEVCTVAADCKAGVAGTGLGGEMTTPTGVAVDGAGHVFVTDAADLRVQRFSTDGLFERAWGKDVVQGGGTGAEICTVAADCKAGLSGTLGGELGGGSGPIRAGFGGGSVLVSDANDDRIQVFGIDGAFQRAWGKGVNGGSTFGVCTIALNCNAGSTGGLGGELSAPSGVAADMAGVYVAEGTGRRVQQFAFDGTFKDAWGRGVLSGALGYGHCTVAANCLSGTSGSLGGEFVAPSGIAADDRRPFDANTWVDDGIAVVSDAGTGRMDELKGHQNINRESQAATSTTEHRYDLYFGTLTVTRTDGTVIRTAQGFASQIRLTQAAADNVLAALGPEPRVALGFAGQTPDGQSWITSRANPDWWEHPNGTGTPLDQPSYDARATFEAQMSPGAASGESAACTDTPGKTSSLDISTADPWPFATEGAVEIGPGVMGLGDNHASLTWWGSDETLVNVNVNAPAITVHPVDRICVISPAPPGQTQDPAPRPPTFAGIVTLPALKALRACSSRRHFKIHLTAPSGDPVASATVTVNGKTAKKLSGKKLTSTVDLRGLPKGKFTVTIALKLKSGTTLKGSRSYKTCAKKKAPRQRQAPR